ncbi:MAG: hypothetical protein EXR08_05215 [Alphaproteobacteria bacterium]|nr:hypothetical protein [Alphaproteobacteria bacterium]
MGTLDLVHSYIYKMGIVRKLGFTLSAYALFSIISIAVIYGMLQKFNTGLSSILEVGKPMDAAAYKMEGDIQKIGLTVDIYLQKPHPNSRKLLEGAIADFEQNLAAYLKLAVSEEQLGLSRNINGIFSDYARMGRDLIDPKSLYDVRWEIFY